MHSSRYSTVDVKEIRKYSNTSKYAKMKANKRRNAIILRKLLRQLKKSPTK